MTFLGSSDHFSLGSKWFWYLHNDKMYPLGPTERHSGVRNGPRRAKKGPQNPTGPIWAQFGLFFGPRSEIFSKIFFLHYFTSPRVWDRQKTKIHPVDPPTDPIWAHSARAVDTHPAWSRT